MCVLVCVGAKNFRFARTYNFNRRNRKHEERAFCLDAIAKNDCEL